MNPKELEILGDGNQEKSYLYIEDCIGAIMHLKRRFLKNSKRVEIYNVGSRDQITVKAIADIVIKNLGKSQVKYSFSGGLDGGRGWKGDVKKMQLAIDKLLKTNWKPKYTSNQAVNLTVEALVKEIIT
jgi:UDP-glucose 4-epimerase